MKWTEASEEEREAARRRRHAAADKYQPNRIRLLLVGEAPPEDLDRYFYFEEPESHDLLFDHVSRVLFESDPVKDKTPVLKALRKRGIFLIDLKPDDPMGDSRHAELAKWLPIRAETLAPERILLLGTPVYRHGYSALQRAGLPVVDKRVELPTAGHEAAFAREFRAALVKGELERLIKPL